MSDLHTGIMVYSVSLDAYRIINSAE